jgi:integrase
MPRKKSTGKNANGTGSIRKVTSTKNGTEYTYWQARYTEGYDEETGKQIQRSISGKTQSEVALKLKQALHELDSGSYIAPSSMTVKDWLDIWQNDYLGDVKDSTKSVYEADINTYIVPKLGNIKLESLNPATIQKFYNRLCKPMNPSVKPLSPKMVKCIHGVLHGALKRAVALGYLHSNPADFCVLPKVNKPDIKPMDETYVEKFLAQIEGHPHEFEYKIALFTGLREGELLGLTWDCVDFDAGTLYIKQQLQRERRKGGEYKLVSTKNSKCRLITLAPSVIELFRLQKVKQENMKAEARECWHENNYVFTGAAGDCISYRTLYDCFKRVMVTIGSPATRFHDLRHTYAMASLKSGDDIKTVQENLGHASASFTLDVYGYATAQMKRDSANRMETFIKSVSGPENQ